MVTRTRFIDRGYMVLSVAALAFSTWFVYKSRYDIAIFNLLLTWFLAWQRAQSTRERVIRERLAKQFLEGEQVMFTSDHIADIITGKCEPPPREIDVR